MEFNGVINSPVVHDFIFESLKISILIHKRCNFACTHCNIQQLDWIPDTSISSETLNLLFEKLAKVDHANRWINIYGGEPTLDMNKVEEIVGLAKKGNFRIRLSTNGWWYDNPEMIEKLNSLKFDFVQTSTDSYHDPYISWENVQKAMAAIEVSKVLVNCDEKWDYPEMDDVFLNHQQIGIHHDLNCVCPKLNIGFIILPNDMIYINCGGNFYFDNERCWKAQHIKDIDFVKEFEWLKKFNENQWWISDRLKL
jgi:organic radical activating enzyme